VAERYDKQYQITTSFADLWINWNAIGFNTGWNSCYISEDDGVAA
jgi:hypothetical protein